MLCQRVVSRRGFAGSTGGSGTMVVMTRSRWVIVAGEIVADHRRVPAEPMSYRGAPWLEREERFEEERPDLVLRALPLEAGDVVGAVGSTGQSTGPHLHWEVVVRGVPVDPDRLVPGALPW